MIHVTESCDTHYTNEEIGLESHLPSTTAGGRNLKNHVLHCVDEDTWGSEDLVEQARPHFGCWAPGCQPKGLWGGGVLEDPE